MIFFIKNNSSYCLFFLIGFIACHDKAALKQALIEKTVKERVALHIKKKKITCAKGIMSEAIVQADSFMIKFALNNVDTSSRINRPVKPSLPMFELPVDTTPIKPLFEDTIARNDGVLSNEKPQLISKDTILN